MRHAVLGAGGIGGLIAAVLAKAGEEVVLLLRQPSLTAYPGRIQVESVVLGNWQVDVPAVSELDRPVDVLWVTTKATGLTDSLSMASASRVRDALVVPLLNGVDHLVQLRTVYPRVAGAAIRVESERTAPGHIRQLSPFIRVELAPPTIGYPTRAAAQAGIDHVANLLRRTGVSVSSSEDELTLLWDKLTFLAPLALATTALQATLGQVRDTPEFRGCQDEALAVARSEGARLDDAAARAFAANAPAGMRSSMQKDAIAGRALELDAIAGPLLRGGRRHSIPVSATAALEKKIASVPEWEQSADKPSGARHIRDLLDPGRG